MVSADKAAAEAMEAEHRARVAEGRTKARIDARNARNAREVKAANVRDRKQR
jgi:hypothetical protein